MQPHAARRVIIDVSADIHRWNANLIPHLRIEQLGLHAEKRRKVVPRITADMRAGQVAVLQRPRLEVAGQGIAGINRHIANACHVQAGLCADRKLCIGVRQTKSRTNQKNHHSFHLIVR